MDRLAPAVLRDLCRKAADDATVALHRTSTLAVHPADKMSIALSAASGALGAATGFAQAQGSLAGGEFSADTMLDVLWDILRPMASRAADDIASKSSHAVCRQCDRPVPNYCAEPVCPHRPADRRAHNPTHPTDCRGRVMG